MQIRLMVGTEVTIVWQVARLGEAIKTGKILPLNRFTEYSLRPNKTYADLLLRYSD